MIQPPRITQLTRRHWDEIEIDASDRIWVLLGSAIHVILERGKLSESLKEEQLEINLDGITITGRPDLWYNYSIIDYKVTSIWNIIFEPKGREEYHAQLNCYYYLYKINGFDSSKLQICAILRDWQQSKAHDAGYPPIPVAIIEVPIWPDEKVESYLKERIRMHLEAEKLPDDALPLCTPKDMWSKPTTYAIMKPNRKSAVRVCNSREEAESKSFEGEFIVERPGKRSRCEGRYCDVRPFCSQFQQYKEGRRNEREDSTVK